MKATRIITAGGEVLTVEAGEIRCLHGEEINEYPIDVEPGTLCDLCGAELTDRDDDAEAILA